MLSEVAVQHLQDSYTFFKRSSSCLEEADSGYAPKEGMYTVAQLVAHVAQTYDWFMEGMFSSSGFDLNFEEHMKPVMACTSLEAARKWLKGSVEKAVATVSSKSDEELMAPLPAGPVMGGAPRMAVFSAITDHTASHRGSLAVYSRLLGKVPQMPYMD